MPEDIEDTAANDKIMREYREAVAERANDIISDKQKDAGPEKADGMMEPNPAAETPQVRSSPLDAPALMQPRSIGEALDLARSLANTELVPSGLQGKPDAVLLIIMDAMSKGANILAHLRSRNVVKGNLGVAATAVIAEVNRSGKFKGMLRFEFENLGTPELTCTAVAVERETGEPVVHTFALAQAVAAGWTVKRDGSTTVNWLAIPEQMCAYRAATFFARLYCPEAVLGLNLDEEIPHMNAGADADRKRAEELTQEVAATMVPKYLEPGAAAPHAQAADDLPQGDRVLFESSDPSLSYD